jgi:hypothetical protein
MTAVREWREDKVFRGVFAPKRAPAPFVVKGALRIGDKSSPGISISQGKLAAATKNR